MAEMIRTPALGQKYPGDTAYPITQGYGVYNSEHPEWYDYAKYHGLKAGEHPGLDVGAPRGTQVFALNPGTVEFAGFSESFRPRPVVIKTKDNPETRANEEGYIEIYGHLMQDTVKRGDTVKPGTHLGFSGEQTVAGTDTPDGSGAHVHFEIGKLPSPGTQVTNIGAGGVPGTSATGGTPYTVIDPHGWLTRTAGPDTGNPGNPDNPEQPTEPGTGSSVDITGLLANITEILKQFWWIVLGAILIALGIWKLL